MSVSVGIRTGNIVSYEEAQGGGGGGREGKKSRK